MEERRQYQRRILVMYLHVFDYDSGKVLGYLGDISTHGLMLVSEVDLDLDLPLPLGIRLHKLEADLYYVNSDEHEHILCHAEQRWSRKWEDGLYAIGFMFIHIEPVAAQAIENLIQRIGQDTLQQQDRYLFMDALLRLEQPLTPSQQEAVGNYLSRQHGVVSVSFRDETPHLMVVQYRRDRITPPQIVYGLKTRQIDSRLVKLQ